MIRKFFLSVIHTKHIPCNIQSLPTFLRCLTKCCITAVYLILKKCFIDNLLNNKIDILLNLMELCLNSAYSTHLIPLVAGNILQSFTGLLLHTPTDLISVIQFYRGNNIVTFFRSNLLIESQRLKN